MDNLGIKIVSTATAFPPLNWLQRPGYLNYVTLSKNSSVQEVDLFLIGLFGYSDIDFAENPNIGFRNLSKELKKKDCVALSGGHLFFDDNNEILTSCCCELENWRDVLRDFSNEKSPWLGHDPTPVFEYISEDVIVWSDDCIGIYKEESSLANRRELASIKYRKNDFNKMLLAAEKDIKKFVTIPLKNRIQEIGVDDIGDIMTAFHMWLDITV